MGTLINFTAIVNVIVFSLLGVLVLFTAFLVIERVMPQDLYKEVVLNRNLAAALVAAAFIIAMAIIIAGAIHG